MAARKRATFTCVCMAVKVFVAKVQDASACVPSDVELKSSPIQILYYANLFQMTIIQVRVAASISFSVCGCVYVDMYRAVVLIYMFQVNEKAAYYYVAAVGGADFARKFWIRANSRETHSSDQSIGKLLAGVYKVACQSQG